LRADNRWVKLAAIIPWDVIEERYATLFDENNGTPAKPARMPFGALIIKEKCGYSDAETVEQITENPYLQYFIGLKEYQTEAPFDPSLMVHFRKRFNLEIMKEINELICLAEKETAQPNNKQGEDDNDNDNDNDDKPNNSGVKQIPNKEKNENKSKQKISHQGKLILDATCVPADIRYPTDISLLNEAREKLEAIIDVLYKPLKGKIKKPRTYRKVARKEYLKTAEQRRHNSKKLRKSIGKQLGYVKRDLKSIDRLLEEYAQNPLTSRQQQELNVIRKLYQQQKYMYDNRTHSIEDRIVSISQPHVRPIVRGKANAQTEFGAKVAISLVNGYAFI